MLLKTFLPVLLVALLTAAAAAADQAAPPSGEARVRADRVTHEQNEDVIRADGNVELLWGGMTLYADMARYLQGEAEVQAEGRVKLLKDGDVLTGDRVRLRLEPRTGMVENGHMFVKKTNLHLRGAQIEKTGEQDYRLKQGSVTSCDGEKPSWKFLVDDLKITMDDFATGRNAFFYLGEIPVFWTPYILFPVKTERQSGFFFPKFGNSGKKGVFLDIPYYWAISPSSDATVDLDLQSKRGAGIGLDYRYLSGNKGHGENQAYLIFDTKQDRFRGDVALKQQVNFTPDTYWRADVNLTLDRDFYRDYGVFSGEYNKQYLGTTAFLSSRHDTLVASGGVDLIHDLDANNNRATLQKLPYLSLMGTGEGIGSTPFYYSFTSSMVQLQRDVGGTGERFSFTPTLGYGRQLADGVTGRGWVGYGQRFYHATTETGAEGWHGQGAAEGGISLQTQLGRTFDVDLMDMSRLRHLIVPELRYEFREKRDESELPFFDFDDRPTTGQTVTVSLQNVLTGKSVRGDQVAYRDLLRLTLSQGYQMSGERRDLLVLADDGRPFADTRLKAEAFPIPELRIMADLRVSPYSGNLTNGAIGVDGGAAKGNQLGLYWHHVQGQVDNSFRSLFDDGRLDYLEGRFTLVELQPFTLSALGRYSFDKPGFLETLYSVEYKHQCWSLNVTYRERLTNNDRGGQSTNNELTFNFTLAGLGPLGPLKAF